MNKNIPSGTETVRPFLPAKDFAQSKRFYDALGFEKMLDGEVAIFGVGNRQLYPAKLFPEGMG